MRSVCFFTLFTLTILFVGCGQREAQVDALRRSKVDALNKASFKARFDDASKSELYARFALFYISDSLPQYADGKLRAWNNLATAYYNRAVGDSVLVYIDSVLSFNGRSDNKQVEQLLARLLMARQYQRNCNIADSYKILYDIENSGFLDLKRDDMLYNLAKSEFYITTTTLNYHYRNKPLYQQAELLTEMEECRRSLKCDYAEDMSLNYAIAYGYYSLCSDSTRQPEYMRRALNYCFENLQLLDDSLRYSTYHLGNTYQLIGFMLWGPRISSRTWTLNSSMVEKICSYTQEAFGFGIVDQPDRGMAFLHEAAALFFLHDDPYQRLGAVVAAGRYCMAHGDTSEARNYFTEALVDSSMFGVAPKFEAMLYEGLLTSGCAENLDEVAAWTRHELQLLDFIKQNEKADFVLQTELSEIRKTNNTTRLFAVILAALALALLITLLLLRRRTKSLQRETKELQQAKREDVERIANVETCLSVLRHDITPFVSYLQNERMPDELKREVTAQLIRTFENIKNWTNLSIPSGLQFRKGTVVLQSVFDSVAKSVSNLHPESVTVTFVPTDLSVCGDGGLLEIMLRNLVSNAVQHTTEGSVIVSAAIYADNSDFVQVSVADTGCGMSGQEIEDLFRTDKKIKPASVASNDNQDSHHGSGFGLILCRYIIKKHDDNTIRGCRIWAESEPGKGSSFHFLVQSMSNNNHQSL